MKSVFRIRGIVSATVLLCLFVFVSHSVQAATLTVSNTADGGNGSLRQAIIDATGNAAANTINFNIPLTDPGYNALTDRFTITLLTQLGDLPLAPLDIDNTTGRGVTVKGNNTFRIFTLVNSAVVHLTNLTISHGSSNGGLGGGIYMGDSAVLFLTNCMISNNTATNGGGGVWVNDSGTLHVINSTISNNTATSGDGGGGIYINNSGTLNITSSTVSGNIATTGGGGGIYNGVSGTVNATNITVNGNTAGNLGGGILNNATATISSSTISGNTATNGGGGIYNNFTATLNNSLIAVNTGADGPDLLGRGSRGKPFTGNSNLIGNADGSEAFGPTTNQLGSTGSPINPRLGPLQDNGGPTLTQALLACSPAIDAGTTALATDQRGEPRPQDGDGVAGAQSDIGAFEVQSPLVCNVNGTPTAGQIIISEFRLRGPAGATDDFVEIYNTTNAPFNVVSADDSAGWAVATSDGVVRGVVPVGVTIPARGHFLLGCNCSYFTPDALLSGDMPDNTSFALFSTTNPANFTNGTLLDAVGFTGAPALYFEATPLVPVGTNPVEHSFLRRLTTGLPQDLGDNAADFVFITTDGSINGGIQSVLGAPGPENLSSHIQRNSTVKNMLLDPAATSTSSPNRARVGTPVANGSFGTLSFRRRIRNMTGEPVTQLRFRIVDLTTQGSPGEGLGQADLRAVDSSNVQVTTSDGILTVNGTLVGLPPTQANGGGLNSTFVVTLPGGALADGATLDLQLVLGVEQSGSFRFFVNTEAVTSPAPSQFSRKAGSTKATSTSRKRK
jgi:parallel beta-helix repeat protein